MTVLDKVFHLVLCSWQNLRQSMVEAVTVRRFRHSGACGGSVDRRADDLRSAQHEPTPRTCAVNSAYTYGELQSRILVLVPTTDEHGISILVRSIHDSNPMGAKKQTENWMNAWPPEVCVYSTYDYILCTLYLEQVPK